MRFTGAVGSGSVSQSAFTCWKRLKPLREDVTFCPTPWALSITWNSLLFYSWFAIHPVSMNNSNHLVNSDNMGYAAYLFEQEKNRGYLPGQVRINVPEIFTLIQMSRVKCFHG